MAVNPSAAWMLITRSSLQKELLRIWHETGVTLSLLTHNIEEALLLADRIMGPGSRRVPCGQ